MQTDSYSLQSKHPTETILATTKVMKLTRQTAAAAVVAAKEGDGQRHKSGNSGIVGAVADKVAPHPAVRHELPLHIRTRACYPCIYLGAERSLSENHIQGSLHEVCTGEIGCIHRGRDG